MARRPRVLLPDIPLHITQRGNNRSACFLNEVSMIVQQTGREPVTVYGIYWIEGERFYWVIPYEGYGGLMSLSHKDISVIDGSLSNDLFFYKDGDGRDMILHWAAEDIIDDLVDCNPVAMTDFMSRLDV